MRRVWIRLTTAYLLCAREFRQNNALALQFWYLSNTLTLRVRALDASKSQHACIILSKFIRKSKYAVINLKFKSAADKAFALAAPKLWNWLPVSARSSNSLPVFKKELKTYLFSEI